MTRNFKLVLLFLGAAAAGYFALIQATPHVLMRAAMSKVSGGGQAINRFVYGPRTTQHSRNIVRPSPDLAYSTCVYDLTNGPVRITAAPSPNKGYVSISVFAANTDNIAVFDTTRSPQGIDFVLAKKGQTVSAGADVVLSPSNKGIVLDRRLAPNAELFAAADKARRADTCAPVAG